MKISNSGYRDDSPDLKEKVLIIPSNIISMKGVSQPITAIPIINGKPDYSKRQVLQPEQDDFIFEGAEAVLELPYAQVGLTTGLGATLTNGFLPNFNFNTSVIPQTTAPVNPVDNPGTVGNMDFNFYTGVEQGSVLPQALNNPIAHQRNLQIQQNNLDYQRQVDSYKNQYSQPDPVQRRLYSTQEQLRQLMGLQDPLQSQTEYNNAVKSAQDRLTTQETPEKEQTGSWWDMFNNIDRTHDLSSSLTRAGYGVGWSADNYDWASPQQKSTASTGNTLATIGAVGNTLLKAGKDFFSGMALANREQQAANEYHEDASRRLRDRNTYYATFQEGGQIQDEKVLTGGYTTGIPENAPITPTAEVERNEFILQNDGSVQQVLGNTHEQGGELMDLEAGTRVISDHLKIGGEFSKQLNKDFDLNTRAKETYAKVIEKYRKKIGLQKVLDEYQGVIGKIKDQEETEHTQTLEINLGFLAQRVQELEAQKAPLEEELSKFTEFVFQEQESKKEETQPTSNYQDGGEVEQILQTYSQVTGIPYEQLLQEFNSLSQQEQQVLLQEIIQELQGAQQQQQQTDPEQIIQAYAQATGTDPNQILQQLQQMSPEQQQQALAQIEQELQQSQQQYREGGNVPKYQEGALTPQQQRDLYFLMMNPLQEMFDRGLGIAESPDLLSNAPTAVPATIQTPVGTGVIAPTAEYVRNAQEQISNTLRSTGWFKNTSPEVQQLYNRERIDPSNSQQTTSSQTTTTAPQQQQTNTADQTHSTTQYPVTYEGVAQNLGDRRDITLEPNEYYGDFVLRNPWALAEAESQRRNNTGQGFGGVNVTESLGWYGQNNPYLIKGLTEGEGDQMAIIPKKGTVKELQRRFDKMSSDTRDLFVEMYGYQPEDIDRYVDDLRFEPDREFGVSSRRYDDKYGRFTASRSWFQRSVVTPEQLQQLHEAGIRTARQALEENTERAKEILGDTYEEVVKGLDKHKNADYVIGALQDQPTTTEEETTKTDGETTTTTGTTTNPYTQDSKQQINLPWSEIDQRIPFPMGMDIGRMQSVSPINLRPINVSVEPTLNEINRQVAFANQMVNFAPDSTRAAQIANLVATGTDASNQAITANNLQNAQLNQQVEQFNEMQIGAADKMNTELAENYTERFLRTKAALESQQAGWRQYMNRLAAQQQQNQFNRNIAQSMFPNMRLNPDGTMTVSGDYLELFQNFLNQQEQKGKTQMSKKDNTQNNQKGGTIKDHLRLTMFKK